MMKSVPATCRFRAVFAFALTGALLAPGAACAAAEFPFDQQLMLDAARMGKVRRMPSLTISPDGTARIE